MSTETSLRKTIKMLLDTQQSLVPLEQQKELFQSFSSKENVLFLLAYEDNQPLKVFFDCLTSDEQLVCLNKYLQKYAGIAAFNRGPVQLQLFHLFTDAPTTVSHSLYFMNLYIEQGYLAAYKACLKPIYFSRIYNNFLEDINKELLLDVRCTTSRYQALRLNFDFFIEHATPKHIGLILQCAIQQNDSHFVEDLVHYADFSFLETPFEEWMKIRYQNDPEQMEEDYEPVQSLWNRVVDHANMMVELNELIEDKPETSILKKQRKL